MRAKTVNETIAFQRYRDPKTALGFNIRREIIEREQEKMNKISSNFEKGYLITLESTEEEIKRFEKDCVNLKKYYLSSGVIPLLLRGVKASYVACIAAKNPEWGSGDLPYNDFKWYTIDEPDKGYSPYDIIHNKEKLKEEIKKAKINKDI